MCNVQRIMNLLVVFVVVWVTVCSGDEQDGQYQPDDAGAYHPDAYGDDGSYIPDYSGRYIPDYSGLYHSDGTGRYSHDGRGGYSNKNNRRANSDLILKSILYGEKQKKTPVAINTVESDEKKGKQVREADKGGYYYIFKAIGRNRGNLDLESPYGGYTNEYSDIFRKN